MIQLKLTAFNGYTGSSNVENIESLGYILLFFLKSRLKYKIMAVNMFHMPAIFIRVVSWASRLAILVIAIPLLTLLISWLNSFAYSSRSRHKLQRPPTVPYYLPYIGHGPEFAAKGPKFFLDNLLEALV